MNNASSEIELRPTTLSDLELLAKLRRELYAHDPSAIDEIVDRSVLTQLIERPDLGRAWLVMRGSETAGYVLVTFCFSVEFAGRFALIDELFLVPLFRGGGIGSLVLGEVEKRVNADGISAMRLEVERSNLGAERLYRRLGFEPHDRHLMTKWLNRPAKS